MKSVVLYHSKYGATKQYAQWIADDLKCDILDSDNVTINDLLKYDQIIFGGAIYVEKVIGLKPLMKIINQLEGKKVFIFAVGLSESHNKSILKGVNLPFYYLRGRFNYQVLTLPDKIMIQIFKVILTIMTSFKKEKPTLLTAMNKPVDFVKEENLKSLKQALKTLEG